MNASVPEVHDLDFLAPVPRDHFVLVATMQPLRRAPGEGTRGYFVLDQTAGVLYVDAMLWGPLGHRPSAVADPLATLAQNGWEPEKVLTGRVLGAMMYTRNRANNAATRLFIEPAAPVTPYR